MARRRVNLQFLFVFVAVLMGALVVGYGVRKVFFRENPRRYIEQGRRNMREGNFVDARVQLEKAIILDSKDPSVHTDLGDTFHELARTDPNVQNADRKAYEDALAHDPSYRPALTKLMKLSIEALTVDAKPANFTQLQDYARRLLALPPDPKDPTSAAQARAYLHIAVIGGWLRGIIQPEDVIAAEMQALVDLQKTDSSNPDVPYYLAQAYIKQASELLMLGKDKEQEANVLFDRAVGVFDESLKNYPDNPVLYLRFYDVLRQANQLVSEDDDAPNKQKYVNRMKSILDKARQIVTKDDAAFRDIYVSSAEFALRQNDPAGAEKLLRELVHQRPDDQSGRLALAKLLYLDPAKRPEMIELLKQEITDPGMTGVMTPRSKRELELQTYLDLSNYLIREWLSTSDPARRAALKADVDKYYQKLADRVPLHFETLKLKAKIALMKGGPDAPIAAMPIIEQAINSFRVYTTANGAPNRMEPELELLRAKCNADTQQDGEAVRELTIITSTWPRMAEAHMLLARLQLKDRELDRAGEEIKALQHLTPDDPAVKTLQMQYLVAAGKLTDLAPQIAAMREDTIDDKKVKARANLATNHSDEALRLLNLVLAEDPADFETVDAVARLLWRKGEKKKSAEVVDAAAKKDPNNLRLRVLLLQMQDAKPEQIKAAMADAINGIKDDFTREMKWFDFNFGQNNTAEALKHLAAAEKISPDDIKVLDLRFQFALSERKWDAAETYAGRLAVKNADQANGRIYRYRIALTKGDIAGAADLAQDMVKNLPQYARSWLLMADVQRMQNPPQYSEAVNNYIAALEKQPNNLDAFKGIIDCYYNLGKPAEALRYIQQGLRQNPGNSYLFEEKVKYDLAYGNPKDAVAPRMQYRDANPESPEAWLMLGAAYFQAAMRLTDANKAEEAKEYAKLAKETFAKGSEKWPDDKFFYAYQADLSTFTHDVAAGEKALKDMAARPAFADQIEPKMLLADYYLRTSQLDAAEAVLKDAVAVAKDTPEAKQKTETQQKLAAFYTQRGKFDLALGQLDENSPELRMKLQRVETLLAANKSAEAQALLKKLLAANPNDPQLLAMNGFLLMADQKTDEAMKALDAALALDPKNQTALYQRGRLFLARGGPGLDSALRDLTAARDMAPKHDVQTRLALAEVLLQKGDTDGCIREMTDAIRAQPSNKDVRVKLMALLAGQTPPRWIDVERLLKDTRDMPEFAHDPDWSLFESQMWQARKDPEKAVKAMEAAMKLANQLKLPPERMGPIEQSYLNALLAAKKYAELLANTNTLLADPRVAEKVWWVYQLRAIAYRYTNQQDKALADFDKAIQIAAVQKNDDVMMQLIDSVAETVGVKPAIERLKAKVEAGDAHWRVILAYLYLKGEDYLNAVTVIDKVLADTQGMNDREREAAQEIGGLVYMQARDYHKAIDTYKQILAHTPDQLGALNNLACIIGELKENPQPKEALRYSQKAMNLMEQRGILEGNTTDTHGWMLTLDGQLDEGIRYLRVALDRQPFAECEYHLAYALLQKNLPGDAVVELEKAKRLNADRRKKGLKVDTKMEQKIDEMLDKAKQLATATP